MQTGAEFGAFCLQKLVRRRTFVVGATVCRLDVERFIGVRHVAYEAGSLP
jgi:hypothetical protein